MSTNDPTATPPSGAPGAAGAPGQPSEEELRAAYEAELSRITSAELMLQAAVSLLNVGSYRLAPRAPATGAVPAAAPSAPSGADLEQARDAIDAVRALLEIIERRMPNETAPLRNALSQLQMIYAREAQAAGAPSPGGNAPGQGGGTPPTGGTAGGGAAGGSGGAQDPGEAPDEQPPGPGPAESSGRLWVPGR